MNSNTNIMSSFHSAVRAKSLNPLLLTILSLLFLAQSSGKAAMATHVIHMSLDGLGAKYLEFYLADAPEQFPNFVRLTTEGAFTMNARCDFDISETVPNHATMFTGRPVLQPAGTPDTTHHGYNNNFPAAGDTFHNAGNANVPYKASFFDVAHDHGLSTALYTGKTRLGICDRSYNALNGALDLFGDDDGQDKIDFASIADVSGFNISNEVNLLIQDLNAENPKRYSFIHIAEPDLTGHSSGWGSANWSNAVRNVDAQIGRILDAIGSNPTLAGNTAVIIAADHGGGGVLPNAHTESYHITNYTIPFFLWGPDIPGGQNLYSLISNRGDPGTNRAEYSVFPQPIRGGDGGNLALSLLGLPTIPGSYFIPELKSLQPPLVVTRTFSALSFSWPSPSEGFFLEFAENITDAVWRKITNGIVTIGENQHFTLDLKTTPEYGFFRLRTLGLAITSQPRAESVFAGSSATFQVAAHGSGPLCYQWYFGPRRVIGATASVLMLPVVSATNAGAYRVVVADYRDAIYSETAALEVLSAPIITQHPQQQLVQSNGVAQFSVQADGVGGFAYQWRKDGVALEGQTGPTLFVNNVNLSSEGSYSVIVTDANGSTESLAAKLVVLVPPTFVELPVSQSVTAGQDVTFSVTVAGNPLPFGFEWRRGSVRLASNTVHSTTATFTVTNVGTLDAGLYRVAVRNVANPVGILSAPATLTVLPAAP